MIPNLLKLVLSLKSFDNLNLTGDVLSRTGCSCHANQHSLDTGHSLLRIDYHLSYFQLESPLNFSMAGVAPICLSTDDGVKPGVELLMAGWGQTNYCSPLFILFIHILFIGHRAFYTVSFSGYLTSSQVPIYEAT
jgi:hypothetical protein